MVQLWEGKYFWFDVHNKMIFSQIYISIAQTCMGQLNMNNLKWHIDEGGNQGS